MLMQKAQWPLISDLLPYLFLPVVSNNATGFTGSHSTGRLCVRSLREEDCWLLPFLIFSATYSDVNIMFYHDFCMMKKGLHLVYVVLCVAANGYLSLNITSYSGMFLLNS